MTSTLANESQVSVRSRRLLWGHAALSLSRLSPFIISLLISRSWSTSVYLAGQFVVLTLAVQAVDAAAFLGFSSYAQMSCLPVILIGTNGFIAPAIIASSTSAFAYELCLYATFVLFGCAVLAFVLARFWRQGEKTLLYRQTLFLSMYYAWMLHDCLFSVAVNVVLLILLCSLLSGEAYGFNLEPSWWWLWLLQGSAVCFSVAACFLQVLAVRALGMHLPSSSRTTLVTPALSDCETAEHGAQQAELDTRDVRRNWLPRSTGHYLRLSFIFLSTALLPALTVFWRLGNVTGLGIDGIAEPPPVCDSCYCKQHCQVDVQKDIVYGQVLDEMTSQRMDLVLDVYQPNEPSGLANGTARPAVVMIHGGAFIAGTKRDSIPATEAQYLAEHGFVVFSIDYRVYPKQWIPHMGFVKAAVHDAKAAIRFVRRFAEQFNVDSARIATWGTSAGAITSFSLDLVDEGNSGNLGFPSDVAARVGLSGCLWPFLRAAGVQEAKRTPWFNVHGTEDLVVYPFMPATTYRLFQSLGYSDTENVLAWIPNGKHEPWLDPVSPGKEAPMHAVRKHLMSFLVRSLKLQHQC